MPEVTYPSNSTQQFVDVEEIKEGIVFLRGGGLRAVIMVAGTNFELKSEEEQDGITNAYQNFLNALDFSIQIIIHSRKLNINSYLEKMMAIREKEQNELLRNQAAEYIEFIRGFVKENEIMTKNFFVVVPYDGGGLHELGKGALSLFSLGKKKNAAKEKEESIEERVSQLRQRIEEVLSGLERVGLRAVVLNDEELLELYYNLYNPESTQKNLPSEKKEASPSK